MLSACFLPCPETSTAPVSNYAKGKMKKKKRKEEESRQHPIKPPARKRERRLHSITGGEMQYTGLGGLNSLQPACMGPGFPRRCVSPKCPGEAAPRAEPLHGAAAGCWHRRAAPRSWQEGGQRGGCLPPAAAGAARNSALCCCGARSREGRAAFHWDCEVGEAADPCPKSASLPRVRQALLPSLLYCPVQDCITKALPKNLPVLPASVWPRC